MKYRIFSAYRALLRLISPRRRRADQGYRALQGVWVYLCKTLHEAPSPRDPETHARFDALQIINVAFARVSREL